MRSRRITFGFAMHKSDFHSGYSLYLNVEEFQIQFRYKCFYQQRKTGNRDILVSSETSRHKFKLSTCKVADEQKIRNKAT